MVKPTCIAAQIPAIRANAAKIEMVNNAPVILEPVMLAEDGDRPLLAADRQPTPCLFRPMLRIGRGGPRLRARRKRQWLALNCLHVLHRNFMAVRFGRVMNIWANLVRNPVVPSYDMIAAKGALLAITRTAAIELEPFGVTVNKVSGRLRRTTDASAATSEAVFDLNPAATSMGRAATPLYVANAARPLPRHGHAR